MAKKSGLNPHRILRHPESYTADSVRYYIETDGATPVHYDSMADYLVDREIDRLTEIARLEEAGLDMQTIIAQVMNSGGRNSVLCPYAVLRVCL